MVVVEEVAVAAEFDDDVVDADDETMDNEGLARIVDDDANGDW